MELNIPKIIEAFKIKISPTGQQKELHGKIFTNNKGECPKGRWDKIDEPYFRIKENKTMI